ncbi:ParA family protein [Actinomadura sp. NPDC048955]|uniref:ParA family protein n=1 Tax=Actinomadura sp. NPDC048955 TaxID=3158228 RepID=UPI0033D35FBF
MVKPRVRSTTKRVALINQKGGVGKTTTTVYTAEAAAELGARVLVIDMDPQANLTGVMQPAAVKYTVNDLLMPDPATLEVVAGSIGSVIRPAGQQWPGVFVVAADPAQAAREDDYRAHGRAVRLRTVAEGLDQIGFDLVLIDCPPSLGLLTVNALTAVGSALVVAEPVLFSVEGVHQVLKTLHTVQRHYHPDLGVEGIVVNQYLKAGAEGHTESKSRLAELRNAYPVLVWDTVIDDIEIIRKATGARAPLTTYGAEGKTAAAGFRAVAERLLNN